MSAASQTSRPARGGASPPTTQQAVALDALQCEQFLIHEARLLDEARFDEWLALFTPDAWYWVPAEPGQASPRDTISLMYDDRRLLETRVRRLASPRIYSQEPRSRTSRIVANVTIEESASDACIVRSKFQLLEYRRETQRIFGGTNLHRLVRGMNGIRIAWKRVDLVNCDAPHEGLLVPF
jgi:benzoate/toluate 1,2-dioxygenase beta subunit